MLEHRREYLRLAYVSNLLELALVLNLNVLNLDYT